MDGSRGAVLVSSAWIGYFFFPLLLFPLAGAAAAGLDAARACTVGRAGCGETARLAVGADLICALGCGCGAACLEIAGAGVDLIAGCTDLAF